MSEALWGARRTCVDSNVIIYLVEKIEPWFGFARRTVVLAGEQGSELFCSEIAMAECLLRPMRETNERLVKTYEKFFESGEELNLLPATHDTLKRASGISAMFRLKLIDAIHVSSAIAASCDLFVTNDAGIRAPGKLRIVRLADV